MSIMLLIRDFINFSVTWTNEVTITKKVTHTKPIMLIMNEAHAVFESYLKYIFSFRNRHAMTDFHNCYLMATFVFAAIE